ncbi:hypothetical protein WICPIJ_002350 [Wickerhamomyces pijperi]|uniref:Eukaryotic translation initiation factor 3 subunit D n=1 Tax=Wickerhamomyces pijperi TaxID=599730 RepID=A0A9P8QC13_WICPI|nr:hypothetical protein WICPIJ_002350 [Wickerhamomyces pijperi]
MPAPFDINSLVSSSIWGPPTDIPSSLRFSNIPYAPYSKGDKIGKVADWEKASFDNKDKNARGKNQKDFFHAYGASAATSFSVEADDEGDDFEVVDNSKSQPKNPQQTTTLLRNKKAAPQGQQSGYQKNGNQTYNNSHSNQSGFKSGAPRRQAYGSWRDAQNERVRESSIKVDDAWRVVSDIEFSKLTKLNFEVQEGEELSTSGSASAYNKKIEKSTNVALRPIETVSSNKTASADPVIKKLQAANTANVYATDAVLSQLMCASRSIYSWDIVVTKKNGAIFLDKRDSSNIDKLTVDENSQDAPSDANDSNIDNVRNLSAEATLTNQYLLANVVGSEPSAPASKVYKYKKYTLRTSEEEETPLTIVVRSEFDARDPTTAQNVLVKSVNEYTKSNLDWKTKYASQRGAIIAAQLKNNNNQFAKWTTQALLAGVDSIKLGFVSRVNFKDNKKHQVVGVTSYTARDLAQQINLNLGNGWGIVKSYIDFIKNEEDGRFLILKSAKRPKLTLYKIPETAATY